MESTEAGWKRLIGHDWVVELLQEAIRHGGVGHAYLFAGPDQIGKTTVARLFAQALNCTAGDATVRPCGRCRPCQLIGADRHPDVILLEPEMSGRGRRTLKIDQIRELQQGLSLAAYEARHKIAILPYFGAATTGAANAFLKTLEEPPTDVILLLTATEADSLLPTVTSRCRVLTLRPLTPRQITAALHDRWSVPAPEAKRLAHLADGRLGWAIKALEQPELLHERQESIDQLHKVLDGGRVARFALAEELAKSPESLPELLRVWLTWWRDLVLLTHGGHDGAVTHISQTEEFRQLTTTWAPKVVVEALKRTDEVLWQLERNANTRLALEVLFLDYPYRPAKAP